MNKFLRLPHGETDERKLYSMPNPDVLMESFKIVYRNRFCRERVPTQEEMDHVIYLADAYLSLTMFELGQECCVGKLRDIWRARRALESEASD
jgi:hypothetical protein